MSKKRSRLRIVNASPENHASRVLELPNEVLLEIWDELAPLERVCVSQVCTGWRRVALGMPKFWAQIMFIWTGHKDWSPRSRRSILYPAPGSWNLPFVETALLRSGDFPLDLSICAGPNSDYFSEAFRAVIAPHGHRIARLHASCVFWVSQILHFRRDWPALRTVTAGFDDRSVVFRDLPHKTSRDTDFPALRQIHFSSKYRCTRFFQERKFPAASELSFAPDDVEGIISALDACRCLSALTLVLTNFRSGASDAVLRPRLHAAFLGQLREVCVCEITAVAEPFALEFFADQRFPNVTFDYQGRLRVSGAKMYHYLRSPCHPLVDPLHIRLVVREGAYELVATDSAQRRRAVLLDASTIMRTRGLWDFYIRDKVVHSATVDALAWPYFVNDVPDNCPLSALTITVGYAHKELKNVSLARLPNLSRLRIETLKPAITFPPRVVSSLVRSRPRESLPLAVLSLVRNCDFGAEETLARLADVVERPAG